MFHTVTQLVGYSSIMKTLLLLFVPLIFAFRSTAAAQVLPCQSNENCTHDECCVVLPWIPSQKGGVCVAHAQKGEICWPPHHDYSKYLFYCPCADGLECQALEAVESKQNMTFHMDVCVTKEEAEENKNKENPEETEQENPESQIEDDLGSEAPDEENLEESNSLEDEDDDIDIDDSDDDTDDSDDDIPDSDDDTDDSEDVIDDSDDDIDDSDDVIDDTDGDIDDSDDVIEYDDYD